MDSPATFAFHAPPVFHTEFEDRLLSPNDSPAGLRVVDQAAHLAGARSSVTTNTIASAPRLSRHLDEKEEILRWANASLTMSAEVHQAFALSAEWLLDNAYLIQEQINGIREDLPDEYFEKLPRISGGIHDGEPRIYHLAEELIAKRDGLLDTEAIQSFLTAFQTVTPLQIAELWAMPLILRLRLVECLCTLGVHIEQLQRESEQADFWANRLLAGVQSSPGMLAHLVAELVRRHPRPTAHFASELVAHLYNEEAALPLVSGWLERSLGASLTESLQLEDRRQAAQQASISNLIASCRHLSQTQWSEIFEKVSLVDAGLAADPAGVYSRTDFETRDRCRKAVEEVARWSKTTELSVVETGLDLANAAEDGNARHVGYHLIDQGRAALEQKAGCRAPPMVRLQRAIRRQPECCYFGCLALLTVLLVACPVILTAAAGHGIWVLCALGALLLLPANELAMQIVNYVVTRLLPARVLPKMSFKKQGIPDDFRTLVVVPMMLTTPDAIRNELTRLETRYVGNVDPNLKFALFSDFSDAPSEHMPEDAELIEVAMRGIGDLNRRYGDGRFFLFHRPRQWSECQQCWIGWERKRGKLERLNGFLMGDSAPDLDDLLCVGERRHLEGIRFVITLDADTQLQHDTARRLVETLAHPLNQAQLSPDGRSVQRGYAIIQPSMSTALPSANATWFARIFADSRGVDPYTRAVSDIYQDLTGEGCYLGKGIYDLRAVYRVLGARFPDAHLLSHDLIEGIHARTALATDIELLDGFPSTYAEWWNRQHRWIRGDWQIIDWLAPCAPAAGGGKCHNPIPAFGRWKIFDNLRRSVTPVAVLILLIAGWLFSPSPALPSLIVAGLLLWPFFGSLAALLLHPPPPGTRFWREPRDCLLRAVLTTVFLVDYALLAIDAIVRVAYRRLVSRRRLLEWETAQDAHSRAKNRHRQFVLERLWIPAFCGLLFAALWFWHLGIVAAAPFLLLWAFSPAVVALLDRPAISLRGGILIPADRRMLRGLARQTWRYFDDFVGPKTHWLPPDNYQETPIRELFLRTSPTNIGLGMLSTLAAADFGYITPDAMLERNLATLDTLAKLEQFEGHLLNWYDIDTLAPLHPRYVSTVDSGNLLASLWTLEAGCRELGSRPVLDASALEGLADALDMLRRNGGGKDGPESEEALLALEAIAGSQPKDLEALILQIRSAAAPAKRLTQSLPAGDSGPGAYWAEQVRKQVEAWNGIIDTYLRPVEIMIGHPSQLGSLSESAHEHRREALAAIFSWTNLATADIRGMAALLVHQLRHEALDLPDALRAWLDSLAAEAVRARENAQRQLARIDEILSRIQKLESGMGLRFLYDEERRLFATGYHVGERRLDNSFYDLLASEARLTSLLAIARREVPVEHWWALGRPFGSANGRLPLLSWSGTMFEYLMPVLLTRMHENSLLDRGCHDAVHCQIAHGRRNGVPWGVSESAFSALDRHHIYQYRAFGVPALALKRGQGRELVIAPYASALALGVSPMAAMANLRRLAGMEGTAMIGGYGFYESIDYSRRRDSEGEEGIVVRCFMAHHQGMSMLAFGNALKKGRMCARFHSTPRVKAVETLLYEHTPSSILPTTGGAYEAEPSYRALRTTGTVAPANMPDTNAPRTQMLSNGVCAVMVTNSGGGFLRWRDIDVTRWHADTTCDVPGVSCYIRELEGGTFWSATRQPVPAAEGQYTWNFESHKAEFRRHCGPCETLTEVAVSAEDDAEVRRVTLVNVSRKTCRFELTSYMELALAPHRADRAHPAFSKMFIETEWLPKWQALLAHRRPRSPDDPPLWVAHLVVAESASDDPPQFESSRAAFVGRGGTLENPWAMGHDLTGATGCVLDPIFSLRRRVVLAPSNRVRFTLITLMADSPERALELVERYSEFGVSNRAFETARTRSQLEMRRLHISPGDAQMFQQLASHLFFVQARLRPPSARLGRGGAGQRALWAQGISGDLPIVAVTIANRRDLEVVRQVLTAHTFWYLQGLKVDLLLISEEIGGYEEPLAAHLRQIAEPCAQLTGTDQPGGVFLRSANKIPKDDLTVIFAAARVLIVAARGTLRQQLAAPEPVPPSAPPWVRGRPFPEEPSRPLPFLQLEHFNGIGGFTPDGKEYAIYLGPRAQTPAPWINVIANPAFGTLVSESGSGFTWSGNSQRHRLTPWSNDPVVDPPGEAIYIRDEESGACWSPTPLPIRELDAYRTRHGQGYTVCEHNSHAIEQELLTFVPAGDNLPLRVQRLRLRNASSRHRRLTVLFYAELVLGSDPEETSMHIATKWDFQSRSLFARNTYDPEFHDRVVFAASSPASESFTADRASFIGRNRSVFRPAALKQAKLSGAVGAGLDPCAAGQVTVEIAPGQEAEVTLLLGETTGESEARELVRRFRDPANVEAAYRETCRWWDDFLGAVQVETPETDVNVLLDRWLPYQTLSCRVWGRSAFYQSSGAYGFRDQLQDVMALVYAAPHLAREHILRAAARQFVAGDVQHWWHPESGGGVRTRISDDLLWLPFVVAHYVRTTGDAAILDETVPFLEASSLKADETESFSTPAAAGESASLLEHCRRAIVRGSTSGAHGLPLIGGGDWNDGLNRVGLGGKGESVWLAWFQICVLNDFAELLERFRDPALAPPYRAQAARLAKNIESGAWDGAWYRRGYFDDGSPLGSEQCLEARIDSLPQSWAAISGAADPGRLETALRAVGENLVREAERLVLLFTPPFDKTPKDVGYIQGYPPGTRENGGQYTHGAAWFALALARQGDGDGAVSILRMLDPGEHTKNAEDVATYKVEPYAVAADVYALEGQMGRGGWTWYTGAAGWIYRVWLEEILGFKLRGDTLTVDPVIPRDWPGFRLRYRYRRTWYDLEVQNPDGVCKGVAQAELDGVNVPSDAIVLCDDMQPHTIRIRSGR